MAGVSGPLAGRYLDLPVLRGRILGLGQVDRDQVVGIPAPDRRTGTLSGQKPSVTHKATSFNIVIICCTGQRIFGCIQERGKGVAVHSASPGLLLFVFLFFFPELTPPQQYLGCFKGLWNGF